MTQPTRTQMASAVRFLATDMVDAAGSGHPGLPLGMADVASALWLKHLRFDSAAPDWPDRDRFVLSAGHGSALLYALSWLSGLDGTDLDHLREFRQLGSPAAGHPEWGHFPGAETTTGPLGQGLANAVGMAIAEERLRAEFGQDLCNHRTWVVAGDGCLMEGISQEAISLAGHLELSRLVVLWDDIRITIDGSTNLTSVDDQLLRFQASNWHTIEIDGHDHDQIDRALDEASNSVAPTLIACKTTIGKGAPTKAGSHEVHGAPLGQQERDAMAEVLDWPNERFAVPGDVLDRWRDNGTQGRNARDVWRRNVAAGAKGASLLQRINDPVPAAANAALSELRAELVAQPPKEATRVSSQRAITAVAPVMPALLGGSADLSTSNGTRAPSQETFNTGNRSGNYLNYGIREHAMAAAMNGLALHGGVVAYAGTFLVFSDYSRPAIRLAALMGLPVIHVLTHDSIGVGEDGPTHQPVEQVCALRAMPNLLVFRPGDPVETVDAWQVALTQTNRPTALVLSRQAVDPIDGTDRDEHAVSRGGYVVSEAEDPDVVLLASGTELGVAREASARLAATGISTAVVSMPCMELFAEQSASYRTSVLGTAPRVAIEATTGQSWHRWLREGDRFVGMSGFGASAPAAHLYEHFGITADAVAAAAQEAIDQSNSSREES